MLDLIIKATISVSERRLRLFINPPRKRNIMSVGSPVYRVVDNGVFDLVVGDEIDDAGNVVGPLPAGSQAVWVTSDESIVTVTPNGNTCTVTTTGKLGTAQVSVTVNQLTGLLNLEVVPGVATGVQLTPSNVRSR